MDYALRGKCKNLAEEACAADPDLSLVRGYYWCPIWNKEEQHWWTVRPSGEIFDPSKSQFPSNGLGYYTPFDGMVVCDECGREILEEHARFEGHYAFCSSKCFGRFVGVI